MRSCRNVTIVAAAVVVLAATTTAQLPIPVELLEAETIYLEGFGVERKLLNHAGEEFGRQSRFTLIADRDRADLIAILSDGPPRPRIDGGPGITVPGYTSTSGYRTPDTSFDFSICPCRVFTFTFLHPASGQVVWQDARPVFWAERGAVLDLVKDLHMALRDAPPKDR